MCAFGVYCLHRYARFRQSAFRHSGCLLTRSGINDDCVTLEGEPNFHPAAPGTVPYDEAYENQAWTGAPEFIFSNELPGGDDEVGPDSASENLSAEGSDSEASEPPEHE